MSDDLAREQEAGEESTSQFGRALMSLSENEIVAFLQSELGVDTVGILPSAPLFSSGIIDSFSLVTLITFVEKKCGLKVEPLDVTLENLDSVERIRAFVDRKLTA